jgi:hypothetical protein
MMTSGTNTHYKSMFDAGAQIIKAEGMTSLFKGAGANVLRGIAAAGVLAIYDKFQELAWGKVYVGGKFQSRVKLAWNTYRFVKVQANSSFTGVMEFQIPILVLLPHVHGHTCYCIF